MLQAPRRLILPPPYDQRQSPEESPFEAALKAAPQEEAGLLIWRLSTGGGRAGLLEWAVVLEPDRPLGAARLAALVGMNAIAEAMGAHGPPERAARFSWPLELRFDKGRIGGARLAAAPGCAEGETPAWMAFGARILADRDHLAEPGLDPHTTSLKEEGFSDPAAVIESFAAFFMLGFDRWTHEGFGPLGAAYAARLEDKTARLTETGDLETGGRRRLLKDWIGLSSWPGAGSTKG